MFYYFSYHRTLYYWFYFILLLAITSSSSVTNTFFLTSPLWGKPNIFSPSGNITAEGLQLRLSKVPNQYRSLNPVKWTLNFSRTFENMIGNNYLWATTVRGWPGDFQRTIMMPVETAACPKGRYSQKRLPQIKEKGEDPGPQEAVSLLTSQALNCSINQLAIVMKKKRLFQQSGA